MRSLVRFWLVVSGVIIAFTSFVYLFISLAFPDTAQVLGSTEARVVAISVGILATCVILWAVVVITVDHGSESPSSEG